MIRTKSSARTALTAAAAFFLLGFGLIMADPSQAAAPDQRLLRRIDVMEKVLDEVLVDSPNLLVSGREPTNGLYLEEFGALFMVDLSLVGKFWGWNFGDGVTFLNDFTVESEDDRVIVSRRSKKGSDSEEDVILEFNGKDSKGKVKSLEEMREERKEKEAERYKEGKDELIEALVDYGETLDELRDDQWIGIAAFLDGSDLFEEKDISRLMIKARVRDLRSYGSGNMSKDDMMKKVVVEEY